jgi:hypothetical protein
MQHIHYAISGVHIPHDTYHSDRPPKNLSLHQVLHELLELEAEHASDNVWAILRLLAR